MQRLGQTSKLYMSSSSSSRAMRAVVYERAGGREVITYSKTQPVPKIKESEVLVKGRFAGVNFIDTYFRTGLYPVEFPYVPGAEGSGRIEELGAKVTGFQKGQEVVYQANATYAEYTAVPAAKLVVLPPGMDVEVGAASLLQGLTALTMIREGYEVKKGDWILIHPAAGGVGLLLVQMCAAVGANIIGTASTDAKIQLAKEHGAQHMVKYTEDSVLDAVRRLTEGKGVHAVLDGVGKTTFDESLEAVRPMGSVISFGNASGRSCTMSTNPRCRPTLHNRKTRSQECTIDASASLPVCRRAQRP